MSEEKNKIGRPSVVTPEVVAKLEHGFSMGFTDLEACLFANISKDSLYRHCKNNPDFSERKEGLKNHPKLLAKTNIYESLKENKKIDDSKWYLERRAKKEFGNNVDITTDGEKITPIINLEDYALQRDDSNETDTINEEED